MNIEGTRTFTASRQLVWTMLLEDVTLSRALPGCERVDQLSENEYDITLRITTGPFSGEYRGLVRLSNVETEKGFDLAVTAAGPEGSIQGNGRIRLSGDDQQTVLHYKGEITVNGRTAQESPRLLRTTANALIRQYFEGLDRQIQAQSRVYTTEISPSPASTREPHRQRTIVITVRDLAAEIQRNRRFVLFIIFSLLLITLMLIGAINLLRTFLRWSMGNREARKGNGWKEQTNVEK